MSNGWFAGLAAPLVDAVLVHGKMRRVTDKMIYRTGDPPNGLFALLAGEIRVTHTTREGRSALLMIGSPGTWFGEASMIDGEPRTSDAIAVGEAVLLQIGPSDFERLTAHSSQNLRSFAQLVCMQYRKAIDHIVTTSTLTLRVRVAQRLVGLSSAHGRFVGNDTLIDLRLSQESLAATIGVSRQSVNGVLRGLMRAGVVSIGYGTVTVRDPSALEAIARSETLLV